MGVIQLAFLTLRSHLSGYIPREGNFPFFPREWAIDTHKGLTNNPQSAARLSEAYFTFYPDGRARLLRRRR